MGEQRELDTAMPNEPRVWVALLRAVNVGGTGKLAMADLKAMCHELGFGDVRTYIASGNVVFRAAGSEADVRRALEAQLHEYAGKPVGVLVRSAGEMATLVAGNPFPGANPSQVVAIVCDDPLAPDALASATGVTREELRLGPRAVYVDYKGGMARSRLKVPAAKGGTARNMNTIAKLAEIAAGLC